MSADPTPIGHAAAEWNRRTEELAERAASGAVEMVDHGNAIEIMRTGAAPTIPQRFIDARITKLDPPLTDLAERWTDGAMNANVLLLGEYGVGKTHAACALATAAWHAGSGVAFMPVVELLDQLRPGGDPTATLHRAMTIDVLVLDDLGAERATGWTGQQLYAIVNRRYLEMKPTIATSNLSPHDIGTAIGEATWSRLYQDALRLTIGGPDRRRQAPDA